MTVEDIIEELFGEIEDEHDSVALIEEQLSENTYRLSARLDVDYVNDNFKLNLPESEQYETLGGLIVNQTQDIPEQGDDVLIENYKFKIEGVSSTKIDVVLLSVLDPE